MDGNRPLNLDLLLTQDVDVDLLVHLLNQVDPIKPLGTKLHDALLRIGPIGTSVEAVCLRLGRKKRVEVFLTRRAENEVYPGEFHCPGTFIRSGETIADTFQRLGDYELGGRLSSWRHIGNVNHPEEMRGHCISTVYLCELLDQPNLKGAWYPISDLPPTVETHQKRIIPMAAGIFAGENEKLCW